MASGLHGGVQRSNIMHYGSISAIVASTAATATAAIRQLISGKVEGGGKVEEGGPTVSQYRVEGRGVGAVVLYAVSFII